MQGKWWSGAALAAVLACAGAHEALAKVRVHEDAKRGFAVKVDDDFRQVPPKLTGDEAYLVGEWYRDEARYAWVQQPEFKIMWFPQAKSGASTPGSGDAQSMESEFGHGGFGASSLDEHVDRIAEMNPELVGSFTPMAERWGRSKKGRTRAKVPFEWVEFADPKAKRKKGEFEPKVYVFAARLELDRPGETVDVGFFGMCGFSDAKDFQKEFLGIVESFTELEEYSDSRNVAAGRELSDDPETRRAEIKKSKVIDTWASIDTPNYVVLYDKDVHPKLVHQIAEQIEAIRAQIYEKVFPPDRPITAISVVRICKDRTQYMAYGAPGGSAGYWSSYHQELVFYEESTKKDSLRVLYHEAFHQYIHYSVGEFAPHSWFNEGHGDYFAGHDYEGRRFVEKESLDRKDQAKRLKREGKVPPLMEWLTWSQPQYYGNNGAGLSGLDNYALGWDFVYFLRTSRKAEYRDILDRYFRTLKARVGEAAEARRKWQEGFEGGADPGDGGAEPEEDGPGDDPEAGADPAEAPDFSDMASLYDPRAWLDEALEEAFRGIDVAALEKEWLAF